jgi:hypothetical protein
MDRVEPESRTPISGQDGETAMVATGRFGICPGAVWTGFVHNRPQNFRRQPLDPARQSFCDARELFRRCTLRGLPRPISIV